MAAGRPKGQAKTGGRAKGTPNKNRAALIEAIEKKFGKNFHPVIEMLMIYNDESWPKELRMQALKEASKYISPQLKAIEHSGDDGSKLFENITIRILENGKEQ